MHWLRKMQGEALFPRRAAGVSRRPIGRNTEQAARMFSRRLRSLAAVFTLRRRECCRCRPGCSGRVAVGRYPRSRLLQSGFIFLTSAATSLRVTFWFSGFPSLSSLTSATFSRSSADSFSSFFIACIFFDSSFVVSGSGIKYPASGPPAGVGRGFGRPDYLTHLCGDITKTGRFCNPHRRAEVPDKMAG